MFSFLKNSNGLSSVDKVWKTKLACHRGTATEGLKAITQGHTPMVFCFFQEEQERFVDFLISNKAPYFVLSPGTGAEAIQQRGTIFVIDVFSIETNGIMDFLFKRSQTTTLTILFLGHYPLLAPESKVLEKLEQRLGPKTITFCLSLEDALLQTFGSDRIKTLMEAMGMGDGECIEHAMVTKAIFRAREKISGEVENDVRTKTDSLWFAKNLKSK